MKDKILEIINKNPKSFPSIIKKDKTLLDWLQWDEKTPLSQAIYNKLYPEEMICKYGNQRNFISFNKGYANCGRASVCQCAKEHVSFKVAEAKRSYTPTGKNQINQKRANTNFEKYGVTNTGQTQKAKNAHLEFYSNRENILKQNQKFISTMMEKHGINNPAALKHVQARMKTNNPMSMPDIAKKSAETRKKLYPDSYFLHMSYDKLDRLFQETCNVQFITPKSEYTGVYNNKHYEFICNKGHVFKTAINNGHKPICKICNPTPINYKSRQELEVLELIKSWNFDCESGNKWLLKGKEIDIVIPSKKIAIEYCGLYWHSEGASGKSRTYHQEKTKLCLDIGYNLITIFSNDWLYKRNIVESILKNKLGLLIKKIYARKCEVKEISNKEAFMFFDENHIQGGINSTINIGLYKNKDLVSVLSLSKSRFNASFEWEITRFSSKTNIVVIGGLSKLFSYFVKTYNPSSVLSFADLKYGYGKSYEILGFQNKGITKPNFWVTSDYEHLKSRLKYQKHKLKDFPGFSNDKSAWQIMIENGLDRIWDCGNVRWVWKKPGK